MFKDMIMYSERVHTFSDLNFKLNNKNGTSHQSEIPITPVFEESSFKFLGKNHL